MIERLARVPCDVDLASEYRYREPIVTGRHLVVPVSQSGETADTIAALKEATHPRRALARDLQRARAARSRAARTGVLYTHAGPEIGVASTKCFTTQVVALYLLALKLGHPARHADPRRRAPPRRGAAPAAAPGRADAGSVAERRGDRAPPPARARLPVPRAGYGFPVALEGALKLKEISYIHAEGYASGEMKHGPIALIDEGVPVVLVANQPSVYAKIVSNAEEVRARGGVVIAVVDEANQDVERFADEVIRVPVTTASRCRRCSRPSRSRCWPTTSRP